MNAPNKTTGMLKRDFVKEFELAKLPGIQPDQALIQHMRDTLREYSKIVTERNQKEKAQK